MRSRMPPRPEYEVRMPHASLTARTLSDVETRQLNTVLWGAFLTDIKSDDELELAIALLDPARTHGVFDGDTLIGGGSMLSRTMTFPGAGPTPIAAVTSVGMAPDQRRRGGLTTLMRAELHGLHESGGEPVAALWASESNIYGRFGYGLASRVARVQVPSDIAMRDDIDFGVDRVAVVDAETAKPMLHKLHAEYSATRIGGLSRPQAGWDWWLSDLESHRGGMTAFRFAVHPEGYAVFRIKEDWQPRGPRHEVRVSEFVSLTPQAHASLWRFLIGLDLGGEVRYGIAPIDEPLPFMLVDPRAATMTLSDGLFVRLVDVDRALVSRGYAAPLDVVLDVSDAFCPWNAGRWRLCIGDDGRAEVTRTTAEPDLACSSTDLGAAFLGSTRLSTLAAAGRVRELRHGALRAATVAFLADHEPHCLEVF
jgi:predicted acetyltransferase